MENMNDKIFPLKEHKELEFGKGEVLEIENLPVAYKKQLIELAREFRKNPTESESLLWKALRGKSFVPFKFRRQVPIWRFIVDFACYERRLIIEIDGPIHKFQLNLDFERQKILEEIGWRVMRLSAEEVVNDMGKCLDKIKEALTPGPSPENGRGEECK